MITSLSWRFFFELQNLKKIGIIQSESKNEWYFAFGANLDPEILLKRKIRPLETVEFSLEDYGLKFSHPGPFKGMGFASIDPSPGSRVYGVLYKLTSLDARRMDYYELVPFLKRYRRQNHQQSGYSFFSYTSTSPREHLAPTPQYLNKILNGYGRLKNVPKEYLDNLAATKTLIKMIPADNLGIFFKTFPNGPKFLNQAIKWGDQKSVQFFVRYLRDKSLFERYIHE